MRILHAVSVILAAGALLSAGAARAEIRAQWVAYTHGTAKLKAYFVDDDRLQGRRPAVLMIHAREGMSAKTLRLAEMWAKLGFATFAADIYGYGQGILPMSAKEMQAQTAIYRTDRALMRARARAAFDALTRNPAIDPARIAVIGYCFGGDVAVEFSSTGAPLSAIVTIHGSFANYQAGWARPVKGRFLILHGAEDKSAPFPKVAHVIDELRAAKVPFQLELYSGTAHGFSTPKNKDEERANKQSIATTVRYLKEVFSM